jgi:hypothetical protein
LGLRWLHRKIEPDFAYFSLKMDAYGQGVMLLGGSIETRKDNPSFQERQDGLFFVLIPAKENLPAIHSAPGGGERRSWITSGLDGNSSPARQVPQPLSRLAGREQARHPTAQAYRLCRADT